MRGALPGSILILVATILLALVTFSTPLIKSIAFLTATVGGSGNEAGDTVKLGALGYCINSSCKGPTIGYSFDPTQLLGIATSVEGININSSKYSTAVIKGLTYTLVLHPIALALCVLMLITGFLANCGDLSLKCLNSLFSSLASVVTLVALGCDFALFIIAEKRINDVSGGSASLGNALWLTLISWICIFVSSFFFCCGSSGRGNGGGKRNKNRDEYDDNAWKPNQTSNGYADQMRMDALDAETQRKNKNALPQFATYETEHIESVPLKHDYEDQMGPGHALGYANIADGGAGGGHGYSHEYGYADGGYTPNSENGPYGGYPVGGPQPMDHYIPGVGVGAQRAVPPADVYHDSQYHQEGQAIGYPHNEGPSTYPGYHDDESIHSYGAPVRAPSWASHHGAGHDGDGYGMSSPPPVPAIPSHMQQQSYSNLGREPSLAAQGHPVDYSGATFGGSHTSTSPSPYDAIQQATAAGQRARGGLPEAPIASPQGDDGFGLAVLQAGAAVAAASSTTPNRYNASSQPTSPTRVLSPQSRPLPFAPAAMSQGGHHDTNEPPDYSSEHHENAYPNNNQYYREKR